MFRIMTSPQVGQALVGALVVTTLAFLMAGAVAVGASALLSQESSPQNASSRDLAAQDALAAAVAGVAGQGSAGGSAPCSQTSTDSATLPSGYVSQALCTRVDAVPSGPLTLLQLPWSNNCAVLDVSSYSNDHVRIWFSANGNTGAWVDSNQSGCKQKQSLCAGNGGGTVVQLLLDCDFAEAQEGNGGGKANVNGSGGGQYLHVQNSGQSPILARLAKYDTSGGSIYVLAASTGVPGGPDHEEADIWVDQDGTGTALRYEAAL
jgi:hypothetical protein